MDLLRQAARREEAQRTSASPTARSSARRTRACSRTTTGRWCSTARSTRTATSTSRGAACARRRPASSARSAASSRPARPTRSRAGLRRRRPVATPSTQLDRAGQRARRSRRPATPTTRGRSTATTSSTARRSALYNKGSWPLLARGARRGERRATATLHALPRRRRLGRNDDGTFDPGTDRYFTIGAAEQKLPARHRPLPRGAASDSWGMFEHMYWNNGYVELNYGLWPIHDKDAFGGPFRRPELGADAARGRRRPTTRRRRTAARSASSATSATPGC